MPADETPADETPAGETPAGGTPAAGNPRSAAPAPAPAPAPVLELRDLRIRRGAWQVAVPGLDVAATAVAALVGPSGCGKTTVLLGIAGLVSGVETTGQRRVLGAPWPEPDSAAARGLLAGPVTVLLQDARAALDPLSRVGAQIETVTGAGRSQRLDALSRLGLDDAPRIAAAYPHELSGGQAQKVLLAIALLRRPKVLFADEPTASLDGASIDGFVRGLAILREECGCGVLLATHDLELVRELGATTWAHRDGRFERSAGATRAFPEPGPGEPGGVVLRATGIERSFRATPVLRGLDLAVHAGEVVAVVGPSGCGKSTLARILTGHLAPDAGEVQCTAAAAPGAGRHRCQLLFQDAFASLTPHRTIRSLLDETRVGAFDPEREAAAVGFPPARLDRRAAELSGGERRRAALLRALSVDPAVLVLDEPTASLDHETAVAVMELVLSVQRRRGLACLLITHDRQLARVYARRVLALRGGRLA